MVWTSGGLDKLEIYQRLGVGEVWFWISGRIRIQVLRGGGYQAVDRSHVLPDLDVEVLAACLDRPKTSQAVRAFREALGSAKPASRPPRRRRR